MSARALPQFVAQIMMLISFGAGSALAQGGETKGSDSKSPTQQASLTVQVSAEDERARQREEELKLVEWARKERERKAAEEEKLRLTRRQRAEETISGVQSTCTIKPVMSDGEIEACRRVGR